MSNPIANPYIKRENDSVKDLEGNWQSAIENYYVLRNKIDDLQRLEGENHVRYDIETKHQKMMKMQKQYDIRNMVEIEQSIIVFTGIGLVFLAVVGILILKK